MKIILLVPFHERGYEKLSSYLERTLHSAHLPIPVELCKNTMLARHVPSGLSSYIRVWRPVLEILSTRGGINCYLTLSQVEKSIETSIKLIGLVLKAKIFEKIDLNEWMSVLPDKIEPLTPSEWSGILVVDRFTEYCVLLKRNISFDYASQLEKFIPTPLDLLLLVKNRFLDWSCDLRAIIKWAVKYYGEYIITSRDLTEAYDKLKRSGEYVDMVRKCASNEDFQYYFT